jgi:hypothetical protein
MDSSLTRPLRSESAASDDYSPPHADVDGLDSGPAVILDHTTAATRTSSNPTSNDPTSNDSAPIVAQASPNPPSASSESAPIAESTFAVSHLHNRKFIELSPTVTVEVEIVFDKPSSLWEYPEIRQSWSQKAEVGEMEVKATWDELFYDLVIVASIGNISASLRWNGEEGEAVQEDNTPHSRSILHFCLLFAS